MPLRTCDYQSLGLPGGEFAMEIPFPDGQGRILIDCQFTWDGLSVYPNCDGPVTSIRVRNTHPTATAWAVLPDKKRAPLWLAGPAGTDVTTTKANQLANLGLSNASDVQTVTITFTQPT